MTVDAEGVARVLGGERTLGHRIRNVRELRESVEQGLPVAALDAVAQRVAGSAETAVLELKHRMVPRTTLRRRTRLTAEESERVERLARMTALAEQVWEDEGNAHLFLTTPQPQLGGERPIDLARSDLGTREVEDLLLKLEYSLPV